MIGHFLKEGLQFLSLGYVLGCCIYGTIAGRRIPLDKSVRPVFMTEPSYVIGDRMPQHQFGDSSHGFPTVRRMYIIKTGKSLEFRSEDTPANFPKLD